MVSFGDSKWQGEKAVLAEMQGDPLLVAALTTQIRERLLGEKPLVTEPQAAHDQVEVKEWEGRSTVSPSAQAASVSLAPAQAGSTPTT